MRRHKLCQCPPAPNLALQVCSQPLGHPLQMAVTVTHSPLCQHTVNELVPGWRLSNNQYNYAQCQNHAAPLPTCNGTQHTCSNLCTVKEQIKNGPGTKLM